MKQFPDDYPENLLMQIMEQGGEYKTFCVYRILGFGLNDPRSFWSTFQEIQNGLLLPRKKYNIGHYSTSCNTNPEEMKVFLKLSARKYPRPIIGMGYSAPCCGPVLQDNETHVHWWIFKDSEPWKHFKEMSNNE